MKFLDQILAQHLFLRVTRDASRSLVPLVDQTIGVDTDDRCVRRIDELRQILRDTFGLGAGY